jgi:PAS domain S-box-containing protein
MRPIRVVLIDANDAEAADLREKMSASEKVTFSVERLTRVSDCLALLRKSRFDAMLVDLKGPDGRGITSLKELQAHAPETSIVVLTSAYDDLEALETVRAGAQDYLVKKRLNTQALERILLYCMERQRSKTRSAVQSTVSRILAESETISDARLRILRSLCELLDCDFGRSWTFDHWSEELIAAESWNNVSGQCETEEGSHLPLRIEKGRGLAGQAWITGEPCWTSDIAADVDAGDAAAAVETGLRSGLAFPISLRSETLGVMELFRREAFELDEELLGVIRNIGNQIGQFSARKHAEQEKEHLTEERLLILDSASEGIYGVDLNGCVTFMNQSAARMLGCVPAEVNGKNSHGLFHHTHPDGTPYRPDACPLEQVYRTGLGCRSDSEYFWRIDGSYITVDYSAYPVIEDGRIKGAVVCFNDISSRKRMEVELRHAQKLEAVGGLAAGIAHEINTPIQFVGDNTRFLQDAFRDCLEMISAYEQVYRKAQETSAEPETLKQVAEICKRIDWEYLRLEIPKAMEQMLDGIERVAKIVRAMKEFSHVNRSSEKTAGDLNKALESTLVVARSEFKYVADLEVDFGDLPPVMCYLGDLNQVFLNLLINAAHAIGDVVKGSQNKGQIAVRTWQDDEYVEISISDSGTGIPPGVREKIFDPFFTTKEVGKGTGQGLTLARAIVVEKHGGTLTFETEIGKGTTFHVRLPVSGSAEPREAVAK